MLGYILGSFSIPYCCIKNTLVSFIKNKQTQKNHTKTTLHQTQNKQPLNPNFFLLFFAKSQIIPHGSEDSLS